MKKLISIVIVLAFFLVFTNFVSAETFCKDSDGGSDVKIKGVVGGDSGGGSRDNQEDYCVTDKELREYYCDVNLEKPVQLLVTQCEEACACGRCFDKEEEVNCEKNYEEYCNDESCYIIEKNIAEIEYISKTKSNEGCYVEEECVNWAGKYSFNDFPIQSYVEPNVNINFLELMEVLEEKFNKEPTVENFVGSDYYIIEDTNDVFFFWISSDKLISLQVPNRLTDKDENDNLEILIIEYLKVHPSDVEKNLNFFEKIINWFKNLFS